MSDRWLTFEKIHPEAKIPKYAHDGDSGFDLHSVVDAYIHFGEIVAIPTGLKVNIPNGYEIQIRPKSGLALNYGITVPYDYCQLPEYYETLDYSVSENGDIHLILRKASGVIPANKPGTIDNPYIGEIIVILAKILNDGKSYHIEKGQKVAQGVLAKVKRAIISEGKVDKETTRKDGGFGSTGNGL